MEEEKTKECGEINATSFASEERMKDVHPHLCASEKCFKFFPCWDADLGEFGERCRGEVYRRIYNGLCWECRARG